MKNFYLVLVVVVFITSLIIGCTPAQPAPAPKPGSASVPMQPIKLTFATPDPEQGQATIRAEKPWIEEVEKATQGKVSIEPYWSESLFKGVDAFVAVKKGISDIAWCFHGYWPGMTPLTDVVTLPFLPFTSGQHGASVLWQLYEKTPEIQREFKDVKVLQLWTTDPYFIMTSKKQVKTVDDMKGLKLRTIGGPPTDMMKALEAVPINMPSPEIYISLEKGTLDGTALMFPAAGQFKLWEVIKYYTHISLHMGYFSKVMNLEKWNSLPTDVQSQIMSVNGLQGSTLYGYRAMDLAEAPYRQSAAAGKYEMIDYTVPPEEAQKFIDLGGKPVWDSWISKKEAKDQVRAKEILNTAQELIKSYKPIHGSN